MPATEFPQKPADNRRIRTHMKSYRYKIVRKIYKSYKIVGNKVH
jgi:hypothetical protein